MKRNIIGIAFILIGLCIIGSALFMKYSADRAQSAMIEDFEKNIENIGQEIEESAAGEDDEQAQKPSDEVKGGAVGIMEIPKIDLKVAIGEGVDTKTLKYAVGHFDGTAMPGEKGNFAVAGHRSYTYNKYFNRLDELQEGDEITIKSKKGEYTYKVYEKKVVEPTEVSVLNKTEDATITLVTCTPIRIATHRLIIKGKLIE